MKSYVFKLAMEPDSFEDGTPAFHASCPALKGCHSWGHTYQEALANIQEAVELYIEDLREAGESIPTDSELGAMELSTPAIAVHV